MHLYRPVQFNISDTKMAGPARTTVLCIPLRETG